MPFIYLNLLYIKQQTNNNITAAVLAALQTQRAGDKEVVWESLDVLCATPKDNGCCAL